MMSRLLLQSREILRQAWPIVLAGLLNTMLLSLHRRAARPARRADPGAAAHSATAAGALAADGLGGFLPRLSAAGAADLLFAGLPFAGLELGGFACVAIAFFLNTGAYYGEILRAGHRDRAARPGRGGPLDRAEPACRP